ncbi:MAG: acyltransferase [Pseudomonadota bacterium]
MQQIKSIQALRALAALAVMLAHLYGVENKHSEGALILTDAALAGVSGVDLFFVISGFIMFWIAGDSAQSIRNSGRFIFARVMRIYPVWWLFAGAMSAYFYLSYGTPWDAAIVEQFGIGGWQHLVKSMFLIPHEALPVLQVGWTLIHEMYFYLVFALLLLLPRSYRMPALFVWAITIIASVSAQVTGYTADSIFSLVLFPMTLEFLIGGAAAWAMKKYAGQFRWIALALGLVWLISAFAIIDFTVAIYSTPTLRTIAFGPAFGLLVYALVSFEQSSRLGEFIPQSIVKVGDWSYSLYLSHLLVISAVARLFYPRFSADGLIDNLIFLILASGAAIFVSAGTFYFFEHPLQSISRRTRTALFGRGSSPSEKANNDLSTRVSLPP